MRNHFKLLVFDFSETLAYPENKNPAQFFSLLNDFGIKTKTKEDYQKFRLCFSKTLNECENWLDFSRIFLKNYFKKISEKETKEFAKILKKNISYKLYPDVKILFSLPFKKAILSNNARFLMPKVLFKHFKIFTPKETKFRKPDKRAFLFVLKYFKINPNYVLMIGDEPKKDLLPFEKIVKRFFKRSPENFNTILIDRKDLYPHYSGVRIKSLKEIVKFL